MKFGIKNIFLKEKLGSPGRVGRIRKGVKEEVWRLLCKRHGEERRSGVGEDSERKMNESGWR